MGRKRVVEEMKPEPVEDEGFDAPPVDEGDEDLDDDFGDGEDDE